MTVQDKQLLLKDLCARLPYGVNVQFHLPNYNTNCFDDKIGEVFEIGNVFTHVHCDGIDYLPNTDRVKPYLRPISSMTEEEAKELSTLIRESWEFYDFLNERGFDYRGLIPKGLALEASEGMYNKGESKKISDIPIPKTVDDAISTLERILSDEDREYLLENGAISMHDSLGRWIRNEWGLWTGSELKDELMNLNKGLNHPDDMSNYIIEEFIKYWNNKL
jgi:hypothetical protein